MAKNANREPMLDMFIFESSQLIEQLEQLILNNEKSSGLTSSSIDEVFRIMHTIKGSSAMMLFNNIATLTHSVEDLFYFIRNEKPNNIDNSMLTDIVLESIDFIKVEINKIDNDDEADGDASSLIEEIKLFLSQLKDANSNAGTTGKSDTKASENAQKYYIGQSKTSTPTPVNIAKKTFKATVFFKEDCEMENIRAFTVIHNLKDFSDEIWHLPSNIIDNESSSDIIKNQGFKVLFKSDFKLEEIDNFFQGTPFLRALELDEVEFDKEIGNFIEKKQVIAQEAVQNAEVKSSDKPVEKDIQLGSPQQSIISVNIAKLDKLMDLVGEMVISEAMVTQNPDLKGLTLENFQKAAMQLRKLTNELQDVVMSIRMVPVSTTFLKMNRIVRDMSKKLNKELKLEIIGEETEVDKNIVDHLSDPLMHLIRNSIDHGIETAQERISNGKDEVGTITLEAKNEGGDVLILIKDDGRGLNREKILEKARKNGLINRPEKDLTDKEIYSFIFLPGFSTNEDVTEYSGRGVGMDVVMKNIQAIGGSVSLDSIPGRGTTTTLKIPLTLAIIDGMTIKVGDSRFTLPITNIKQLYKITDDDVIRDPNENEMLMIRGKCYPILRLHEQFKIKTETTSVADGIIIMAEVEDKSLCIFADELLGEQQVVVKVLPKYIKKVNGIEGCTLLGDGGISLILDTGGLLRLI